MERIDPKTQEHLANAVDVPFSDEAIQLVLVLEKYDFSGFFALWLAFILYYFVVLGELYLVGLDHLCDFLFLGLLEAGEHLDEVDGDSKYVFGGSYDLLVLFGIILELLVEVDFSAVESVLVFLESDEARHFYALDEGFVLLDLILG